MRDHVQFSHDMEGEAPDLALETLAGDIRDEMLTRMKHLKNTWPLLSEGEQSEVGNGLYLFAKQVVRRSVALLTKHEFPHAVVKLADFKVKAGKDIEAKITCDNISVNREALGDRTGDMCMLVMIDSETFFGERAPVKTDPDQPGFDLDGDGEEDPAEQDERLALPAPSEDEADQGKKSKRDGKPDSFFGGNPEDLD